MKWSKFARFSILEIKKWSLPPQQLIEHYRVFVYCTFCFHFRRFLFGMGRSGLYLEFTTTFFYIIFHVIFHIFFPVIFSYNFFVYFFPSFCKLSPFGERRWRGGGEGEVFARTTSFISTTGGTFSGAKTKLVKTNFGENSHDWTASSLTSRWASVASVSISSGSSTLTISSSDSSSFSRCAKNSHKIQIKWRNNFKDPYDVISRDNQNFFKVTSLFENLK